MPTKVALATETFTGSAGSLPGTYTQTFPAAPMGKDGSGHGVGTLANDSFAFDNSHTYSNDQYSKLVTFSTGGANFDSPQPAVRCSGQNSTGNCYFAAWDTGNFDLAKYINGSGSDIGSVAGVNAVGDQLECWAVGTGISLIYNGASVLTVTDTALASGAPGPGAGTQTAIAIDDWEGGNLVATAPPPLLGNLFVGPIGFGR